VYNNNNNNNRDIIEEW